MLPDEDDDEWEEDNAFVAAVAPTRVAKAAATSPSLRERRPNVTKSEEDDSAPAASSSSATLSPSLFEGVPKSEPLPPGTRLVRVKDAVIQFTRSPYQRASRAARPNEPSSTACAARKRLATQAELELKREGRTRVVMDNHVRQRASGAGGKGPSVHAQSDELQPRMNHIAQLKAKNIETGNQTPSWLLCGKTADQCYDQLAESALRANAVNSGIVKRKDTQGANYQTTYALTLVRPKLGITRPLLHAQAHQLQGTLLLTLTHKPLPRIRSDSATTVACMCARACVCARAVRRAWGRRRPRSASTRRSQWRWPRRRCAGTA
jgi:hypothetical protein